MIFIALISFITGTIAVVAAYFSVYGLAHIFAAAFWSVVCMGAAIEAGKLVTASFLYRFKDSVDWRMKLPGFVLLIALMGLTSTGIYGYLSAAYQTDTVGMKKTESSLTLKKEEQETLQKRKAEIDEQIAAVPPKDTRGKQRVMTQFGPEITRINDRLVAITAEIQTITASQIETESHVGPIVFIAKAIGYEADKATSLLILLIIFVFDPLAIWLTIATNIAIKNYQDKKAIAAAAVQDFDPFPKEHIADDVYDPPAEVVAPLVDLFPVEEAAINVPEEPKPSETISDLNATFSTVETEDVEAEEGTTAPTEELETIYNELSSKDEQQLTPTDKETVAMIEKFFKRQGMIKNIRSGNLD